ncbi:hypothetical protein RhiJN_21270 [Ceratobasidium sp. AG-Ba]|nr:hypothetical protein RhiJN_21270 [Ceratobasidium sp. AG-Ba]
MMPNIEHHAMSLTEILDGICGHCDSRSLALLARTSKTFNAASIRHLWGKNAVDLHAILATLPGVVRGNRHNVEMINDNAPSIFADEYFTRLKIYAPFVTTVSAAFFSTDDEASLFQQAQALSALAEYTSTHVIFPKLRKINITISYEYQQHVAGTIWLCLLPSPSLTEISMTSCANPYHGLMDLPIHLVSIGVFYGLVMRKCSNLKSLSLHTYPLAMGDIMTSDKEFVTACTFTALEKLVLDPSVIKSSSINWLRQMTRLSTLVIESDIVVLSPTSALFSTEIATLNHLGISSCTNLAFFSKIWHSPLVRHLKSVALALCGLSPFEAGTIATLLTTRTPHLTSLTISSWSHFNATILMHGARYLPLRELKVTLSTRPKDIRLKFWEMGQAERYWPELEKLLIPEHIIDYAVLLELSIRFPCLRQLEAKLPSHGPVMGEDISEQSKPNAWPQHRLIVRIHNNRMYEINENCLGLVLAVAWPNMDFQIANSSWKYSEAGINAHIRAYSESFRAE